MTMPPSAAPLAVIDLGSNASRLLVGKYHGKNFVQHLFVRVPLRLGQDAYGKDNMISPATQMRLCDTLNGLRLLARSAQAARCRVVATAAVRDCKNRQQLIRTVRQKTTLRIDVLSGEEEAKIIGAFVALQFPRSKTLLNIDAGGGSTDCSLLLDGKIIDSGTFSVGSARQRGGAIADKKSLAQWLENNARKWQGLVVAISGGSARVLADICNGMTDKNLSAFMTAATNMTPSRCATAYGITLDRAQKIIAAARICRMILHHTGAGELKTVTGGLGEAMLSQWSVE